MRSTDWKTPTENLVPLLDAIIEHIPAPKQLEGTPQMLIQMCIRDRRGIYMPLISPTPEVLQDIQDICVLQDKLYSLTSNAIVAVSYTHLRI